MNKKGSAKTTKKSLKIRKKDIKNLKVDLEDIKKIIARTGIQQQETDRIVKETALQMQETALQMKETDQKIKETDRIVKETGLQMKETDQKIKETDRIVKETGLQMKETDKKVNKFVGELRNRWGQLGENLVAGNLAKRLNEKNIKVDRVATNLKNKHAEFDIIAINGKEVVVVEVKSTLDPEDVDKFEHKINHFKDWWPSFADNKTVYGAMAFLMKGKEKAQDMAEKKGFFVISATGDVVFQNQKNFQPKVFS